VEESRKSLPRNPALDQTALGMARACFFAGQDQLKATALELAPRLNPRKFLAKLAPSKVFWRQNPPEKGKVAQSFDL
jgi:hypothetical protein